MEYFEHKSLRLNILRATAIPEARKSMQARLLRETGKKINMDIPSEQP